MRPVGCRIQLRWSLELLWNLIDYEIPRAHSLYDFCPMIFVRCVLVRFYFVFFFLSQINATTRTFIIFNQNVWHVSNFMRLKFSWLTEMRVVMKSLFQMRIVLFVSRGKWSLFLSSQNILCAQFFFLFLSLIIIVFFFDEMNLVVIFASSFHI